MMMMMMDGRKEGGGRQNKNGRGKRRRGKIMGDFAHLLAHQPAHFFHVCFARWAEPGGGKTLVRA